MSWQEELRELDDALAGGLISATEYRRRSEDLIATASASPSKPAVSRPVSRGPATPDHRAERHARAPRETSRAEEGPGPERREPAAQPDTAPPAPAAATPTAPEPVDDAFTPVPRRRLFRRPAARLAAALAVLALAAALGWFFGFGPATTAGERSTTGTARAAPVRVGAALTASLDALPGRRVTGTDTVATGKLADLGVCSRNTAAALRANGVRRALYLTSVEGGRAYFVVVIPQHTHAGAARTTGDVIATQREHELARAGRNGLPASVTVLAGTRGAGARTRAVYTSGTDTVVVGGTAPHGDTAEFSRLALHVTTILPPH